MQRSVAIVMLAFSGASLHGAAHRGIFAIATARRPAIERAYGQIPLSFEANQGQVDSRVKYLSRGNGYSLFLTPSEAVLSLRSDGGHTGVLHTRLIGAQTQPQVQAKEPLAGTSNYFLGADRAHWLTGVPTYRRVEYRNLYPGIDLAYYGNQRQLEYDFLVAPGADPSAIALEFGGADRMQIDAAGDLVLQLGSRQVREHRPIAYQERDGARLMVETRFVPRGRNRVGFAVGSYDASRPLVIDPTLVYSTYLGGSAADFGYAIAVDSSGNAYVTGQTSSNPFPTVSALDGTYNGSGDAFVTKLNPSGTAVVYSTYLGGSGSDSGSSIAVDSSGNAYVTGSTASTDFPFTAGAYQTANNGIRNAFVAKLNAAGTSLVYATYLGGSNTDEGNGIAVDSSGNAYITGQTDSSNFPHTSGVFQTSFGGTIDAFITKLNAAGNALVYSTFLGGSSTDIATAIAIDSAGNAYVTGQTQSAHFPTTAGAYQTTYAGGGDVFVTELNATGTAEVYSTLLGSTNAETGFAIAVDSSGNAYVTGQTQSAHFPTTAGAYQTSNAGAYDAFVTKLNASTGVVYSTLLGGSGTDSGGGIAVDSAGNTYITGFTISGTNFPGTADAYQSSYGGGGSDAFLTKLNAAGSGVLYSTYFGGSGYDQGNGVAVDASGNVYLVGYTASSNLPVTPTAVQTTYGTGEDAFVAKFQFGAPDLAATKSDDVGNSVNLGGSWNWKIHVDNQGTADATFTSGQTVLIDYLPSSAISYGVVNVTRADVACGITTSVLTCTANAATVTIAASSSFDVSFSATPTATGAYANPTGGACQVNPNGNVIESDASNDTNNNCSDTVTVTEPDLTAAESDNVGGSVVYPNSWTWKITVANIGTGAATFTSGQTVLTDYLPNSIVSYGTPIATRTDLTCSIAGYVLTCTANTAAVIIAASSSFDVNFQGTPSNTGTFANPRTAGGCMVDPHNLITEMTKTNNYCGDTVSVVFGERYPDSYQIGYIANLAAGDSVLDLTNAGSHGGYDPSGGICANVYVFDPNQEMISCCACYLSPNDLQSLSAKQDLVNNTLTPAAPTSVVVKVLASDPVSGAACDPTYPTAGTLEQGMRIWGTTIHQDPSGAYQVTERLFSNAALSGTEVSKLTTDCAYIRANGSGYGLCNSCRSGGQGGSRK